MFNNKINKTRVRGGKRTKLQREIDTNFCIDLYIKGYAIRDIHTKLVANLEERQMEYRVSFQQVYNDIKAAMIDWKKENIKLVDDYVYLELKKLDKIEVELWDSWERSKTGKRKTEIVGGTLIDGNISGGQLNKRQLETANGDPRYLDLLLKVQERRAKLLGYNAPLKVNLCNEPQAEENPASAKYDINKIPLDMVVNMAYKLQDAEFNKRQEESNNGKETD